MTKAEQLRSILADLDKQPESVGFDLRLDLSRIVLSALRNRGWTQSDLARECGMKPAMISRIVHGDANCEFETAGRVLFALGLRGTILAFPDPQKLDAIVSTTTQPMIMQAEGDSTDGNETTWSKVEGETGDWLSYEFQVPEIVSDARNTTI